MCIRDRRCAADRRRHRVPDPSATCSKRLLAARKKVLTDAAAHIVIFVVGDLLLVIAPARPFHTLIMFVGIFGVGIHHVLVVRTVVSHLAGLAVGMLLDRVEKLLAARDVEYPVEFLHGPVEMCIRDRVNIYH